MDTTYGTCAHCSNPSTTKFCSGRCKSAEKYERIKQDPAKYRAYLDRVRAAQKKRHTPVPLPASMRCKCGKDFAPSNTSQVYCSRGCRPRASNPTTIMRCDWCGADCVKERRARRYAKTYCTLECRDKGLSNKGATCTRVEEPTRRTDVRTGRIRGGGLPNGDVFEIVAGEVKKESTGFKVFRLAPLFYFLPCAMRGAARC